MEECTSMETEYNDGETERQEENDSRRKTKGERKCYKLVIYILAGIVGE